MRGAIRILVGLALAAGLLLGSGCGDDAEQDQAAWASSIAIVMKDLSMAPPGSRARLAAAQAAAEVAPDELKSAVPQLEAILKREKNKQIKKAIRDAIDRASAGP